jgi:hypothetical protein
MSVFGEIAKNVGKEVAEGLAKNVEPVVKKAAKNVVDTVEGWGFEPKIGQIASKDYIDSADNYIKVIRNPRLDDAEKSKQLDEIQNKFNSYFDQMNKANDSGKLRWKGRNTLIEKPIDIVSKQFATLEEMGVPRKYTGKIFNATSKPIEQMDMALTLKKLNPPERDVYIYAMNNYDRDNEIYAEKLLDYIKDLTRQQQETFASLLPQWEGPEKDLVQLVKDLKA